MRAEILRTVAHRRAGAGQLSVGQFGVKAGNHNIRLFRGLRYQRDSLRGKLRPQALGSQQVNGIATAVVQQICRGDVPGGHDLVPCRRKSHPRQAFHVKIACAGGVVGEEQNAFAVRAQVSDKPDGKREYTVFQVYGAVHIKNKEFFFAEQLSGVCCVLHICPPTEKKYTSIISPSCIFGKGML